MKTKNKNGELSAYGLACGYVECAEKNQFSAKLYNEGACYHVQYFNRNAHFSNWNDISGGRFWLSFTSLTEARKAYRKLARSVECGYFDSNVMTYGGI